MILSTVGEFLAVARVFALLNAVCELGVEGLLPWSASLSCDFFWIRSFPATTTVKMLDRAPLE